MRAKRPGLNILYISLVDLCGNSGENLYARGILDALIDSEDIRCSLICPTPTEQLPNRLLESLDKIIYLPAKKAMSIGWLIRVQFNMIRALYSIHSKKAPSIIVASNKIGLILPALFCKLMQIKLVLFVEGPGSREIFHHARFSWVRRKVRDFVMKLNLKYSDKVFCAHDKGMAWLERIAPHRMVKTRLFPHPVNTNIFIPRSRETVRSDDEWPFQLNDYVIVFSGSFKRYHALPALIDAMSILRDNQDQMPYKLLLVGDGLERNHIAQMISRYRLEAHVHMTGVLPQQRVAYYLAGCDLSYGVLEPDSLGSPMKVYESLACGVPVLANNFDEFKFISEFGLGIQVSRVSANEIANAIVRAKTMLTEGEVMRGARNAAVAYIKQNHTWDPFYSELRAAYSVAS